MARRVDDDDDEDEVVDLVTFQGALNGNPVDLASNARLAQAALVPAKELVTDGMTKRAELIRVEPKGERSQVTVQVDGVAYSGGKLSKQQTLAVTQMMKLLAGLEPKLRGKPQSGGLKAEYQSTPYEVHVDVTPIAEGAERLTLRLKNQKLKLNTLEDLGIGQNIKDLARELTGKRHGITLVVGPTNSGTTTTLKAILRGLDVYLHAIFSLTKLSISDIYNITPFEANETDDLKATLDRIVRAEGDIIVVDPIKDAAQLQTYLTVTEKTSLITEMPARDCASALAKLTELSGDPNAIADNIEGLFSQKLVRLLCPNCKEAFRPNPKLLAQVGLPPETKVLYRKGEPIVDEETGEEEPPCEKCGGVGFFGRVAMIEYIIVNDAIKPLIRAKAAPDQIKAAARKEGMLTFHKDGLRLVAEGKTSLEELQRIFKPA
jgi:type II secretory ATPase GspE/PulE/Tfp pilus assembly ATPase PilB-like protein